MARPWLSIRRRLSRPPWAIVAFIVVGSVAPKAEREPSAHEVQSWIEGTWQLEEWHLNRDTLKPPRASGLWSFHDGIVRLSLRRQSDDTLVTVGAEGSYELDAHGLRYAYDHVSTSTESRDGSVTVERPQPPEQLRPFAFRREPGRLVLDDQPGRRKLIFDRDTVSYFESDDLVRVFRRVGTRAAPSWPSPMPLPNGSIEERGVLALTQDDQATVKRFVLRYPSPPSTWNGRLVIGAHGGTGGEAFSPDGRVTGTDELALDDVVGEHAVAQGFAYASVDRDGLGASRAGLRLTEEFTARIHARLAQVLGHRPTWTYLAGLSMGGGITRLAVEEASRQYDGAVIIVGGSGDVPTRLDRLAETAGLWRAVDPRIARPLPDSDPRVEAYAKAIGTPIAARVFWPFTGMSATYDSLRRALEQFGLTGLTDAELRAFRFDAYRSNRAFVERVDQENTTGKPLVPTIEVAGTHDDIVSREVAAYRRKVEAASAALASPTPAELHRLYWVTGVWHISRDDDAIESFEYVANRMGLGEPIKEAMRTGGSYLATVRDALTLLDRWVVDGTAPPPNQTLTPPDRLPF